MCSPLMKQYNRLKSRYPDALLLFRVGDYYEAFNKDAEEIASILGVPLTETKNNLKLAGFTFEQLDLNLPKLTKAGHRVAICDTLSTPSTESTG